MINAIFSALLFTLALVIAVFLPQSATFLIFVGRMAAVFAFLAGALFLLLGAVSDIIEDITKKAEKTEARE